MPTKNIKENETHRACNKRIRKEGGQARCCDCVPHSHCEFKIIKEVCKCQCHPLPRGTTCAMVCKHCSPTPSIKGEDEHINCKHSEIPLKCCVCSDCAGHAIKEAKGGA